MAILGTLQKIHNFEKNLIPYTYNNLMASLTRWYGKQSRPIRRGALGRRTGAPGMFGLSCGGTRTWP